MSSTTIPNSQFFTVVSCKTHHLEIQIRAWIAPPCHGKGECDSHGAVVKKKAKLFLVLPDRHISNAAELATFIEKNIEDTKGLELIFITCSNFGAFWDGRQRRTISC